MENKIINIAIVEKVATALKELKNQMVFVEATEKVSFFLNNAFEAMK